MVRTRTTLKKLLMVFAVLVCSAALVLLFLPVQRAGADACKSTGSGGSWNNTATWDCAKVPVDGDTVTIASSSPVTITVGAYASTLTIELGATLKFNDNLTVTGTGGDVLYLYNGINLNGKTLKLNGNGNKDIKVDGGAIVITGTTGSRLYIYSALNVYTDTVTTANSGTLVIGPNATLEIGALSNLHTRLNPGASKTTINGTLKISFGGQVVTNGLTYGNSSTLMYNTGDPTSSVVYIIGPEWPAGISGSSIPMNVELAPLVSELNSSTVAFPINSHRTVRGNMTLGTKTILRLAPSCGTKPYPPGYCGLDVLGNWIGNGGSFEGSNRTVAFKGSSLQTIGGSAATKFPILRIENSTGVLLENVIDISTRLDMIIGNLDLAGFDLSIASGVSISPTGLTSYSASKMIIADGASLCKLFSNGITTGSMDYPIGDNTDIDEYTPVALILDDPGDEPYAGYSVCVRVINAKHPNLDTSGYFRRYFRVTRSGDPPNAPFHATFYYKAPDVELGGYDENKFHSARYRTDPIQNWDVYDNLVDTGAKTFTVPSIAMLTQADYTPVPDKPTAVTMAKMQATPETGQVRVQWTTGQEIGTSGFKVYRSNSPQESDRSQISDIIFVKAGGAGGADYEFVDTTAQVGVTYYYWIEAVAKDGGSTFFGPEQAAWFHYFYLPFLSK